MVVERNNVDPSCQAGPEDGDPFGPAVGPQHHAVSGPYSVTVQIGDEAADPCIQIGVCPAPAAVSVPVPHGLLGSEALDPRQEIQQRLHAKYSAHFLVDMCKGGVPIRSWAAGSS